MRKRLYKYIVKNRKNPMSHEIVLSREFFFPVDENGKEKNVDALNYRVRYCVRAKGSTKIIKCFSTHDKAKEFLRELNEIEPNIDNKLKT